MELGVTVLFLFSIGFVSMLAGLLSRIPMLNLLALIFFAASWLIGFGEVATGPVAVISFGMMFLNGLLVFLGITEFH